MKALDMLYEGSKEFNIDLNEDMLSKFFSYYEILVQWNEKMNLTAITEEKEVMVKHFLDSLSIAKHMKAFDNASIIDVGTGAGFPGIPIKIAFPNIKLTLVDSLNKRINFLNHVINEIDLKNVDTIHGRAEELGKNKDYREKYDYCISRAVASLEMLGEYCIPFVKVGGYFISLKGPKVEEEIKKSEKGIKLLGCKTQSINPIEIPYSDLNHNLVLMKKIKNTPKKFPRNFKKMKNNPI